MPSDYKKGNAGMGPRLGGLLRLNIICSFKTINGSLVDQSK